MKKTVLVTGAGGTVGNYVASLAEANGYRVIASDMKRAGVRSPVRGEVRLADLRDGDALPALVKGADYIVHTAAQLNIGAEPAELSKTNTEAAAALFEAGAAAGVKRFVQLSHATLYADPGGPTPVTEDQEVAPRGPFGMSKRGAETYLEGQRSSGCTWTILRAAPLYGRRGRHFAASLLSIGPLLKLALPVVARPAGGPMGTMVHAEDVARAALHVLERDDAAGEVYNVSDADVMSLGDRIAVTLKAYGIPMVPLWTPPDALYRFVGSTLQKPGAYGGADVTTLAAWRAVVLRHGIKPALRPRLDREHMTLLYQHLVVDSSKLRATGWAPRHASFDAGWCEVLRWYQAERWVPRYVD